LNSTIGDIERAVGHRRIWRLAAPIMLSNLTVPLLGAVDTAVVGHLPAPHHLGAVAVGSTIFNFLYWTLMFLRSSTTGLTAQAQGRGDDDELRAVLARGVISALLLGGILVAAQWPIAAAAFGLIEGSAAVEDGARTYLSLRILAAPLALANFAILGWFIGLRATGAVLLSMTVMNGANMALDLLFVVGFGWGVAGVAAATAIAEALGLLASLLVVRRELRRREGRLDWLRVRDPASLRRLFGLNRDIFVRNGCIAFAFAYFTAQSAKAGDVIVAANAVLLNFFYFFAFGVDGFAHAAQGLIGMAVGARRADVLQLAVRRTTLWAGVVALGYCAVYGLFADDIIALLTSLPNVRDVASAHAPWMIWMPLAAIWTMQLDGIFVGATRGADMRNAMLFALAVFLIAIHALQEPFGNHGLWAAFVVFVLARAAGQAVRYPVLVRDAVAAAAK
jgi:MATE family multidrug resistance protein